MSERQRENIYWMISVGLVALSPLLIFYLSRIPDVGRGHASFLDHVLDGLRFLCVLVAALLVALLFDVVLALLTRRPLQIWRKNLMMAVEHQSPEPIDSVRARITDTLGRLGFASKGCQGRTRSCSANNGSKRQNISSIWRCVATSRLSRRIREVRSVPR
jgi:hypothetical protein